MILIDFDRVRRFQQLREWAMRDLHRSLDELREAAEIAELFDVGDVPPERLAGLGRVAIR